MRILNQHKCYPPVTEQELVEKALQRIAGVLPDQGHRDLLKELLDQGLERAVQRLKEYAQFQPDRFSLQEVRLMIGSFGTARTGGRADEVPDPGGARGR
jgi:hypothetical protein